MVTLRCLLCRCGLEEISHCLIAAAEKDSEAIVRFLLEQLHRLESSNEVPEAIPEKDKFIFCTKLWALEIGCSRANLKIVRDIIASGGLHLSFDLPADRDEEEDTGEWTQGREEPFHEAQVKRFHGLFRACEKDAIAIVTTLLDCGLPVNMRELPASSAVDEDQRERVQNGEALHQKEAWNALHYAAKRGNLTLIQKLIARGADPSLTALFNGRPATPLDVAEATGRDAAVVRYLLKITPRRALAERPEFVLAASGAFLLTAVCFLLSQLLA